jgi:N-glycosylase/DNA lyase
MEVVTARLQGVRVVRQDPWECLISFICSSNNNIARITQMLDKLRRKYGHQLCTVSRVRVTSENAIDECSVLPIDVTADASAACEADGAPSKHVWVVQYPTSESDTASSSTTSGALPALESFELYSFPTVTALAEASEEDLRALGMGYRAKFIVGSAKLVQAKCAEMRGVGVKSEFAGTGGTDDDRGELWFEYLRSLAADAAQGCEKDLHQSADPALRKIKREPELRICSESGGSSEEVRRSREEARLKVQALLMELPGVGRKVADCVALFSLDQTAAVPVDTHVWNIAIRDYAPHLRRSAVAVVKAKPTGATPLRAATDAEEGAATPSSEGVIAIKGRGKRKLVQEKPPAVSIKQEVGVLSAATDELGSPGPGTPGVGSIETMSLTPAVYEMVGQVFRDHFGPYAGWAHSVLFAAELPQFRVLLPDSMQKEMTDFSALQRSAKKEKRDEKAKKSAAGGEVALTEEFEDEIITFSPAPKKVVKSRKS